MFGNNVATSGLTFGKVLGGISKTLSIANQVIPLYEQAKPMIHNAKTILSVLRGLNKNDGAIKKATSTNVATTKNNITYDNLNPTTISNNNSPIFFQ